MPSLHRHGTDQKGVGIFQQVFCNAKRAVVYTAALLATTVNPFSLNKTFLNELSVRLPEIQDEVHHHSRQFQRSL